jgi:hypothetical protein
MIIKLLLFIVAMAILADITGILRPREKISLRIFFLGLAIVYGIIILMWKIRRNT